MTCAAPPRKAFSEASFAAYNTRRALYWAAGLEIADRVDGHDTRFGDAVEQLGRHHAAAAEAIERRNALAASADAVAVAIARAFTRALPALQRHEAEQEARLGVIRAAELWSPAGGASFTTYARTWARKRVGKLADAARAVSRPERERLGGAGIEVVELPVDLAEVDDEPADDHLVEQLEQLVEQLPHLERQALTLAHGLNGSDPVSSEAGGKAMGLSPSKFIMLVRRALKRLRDRFGSKPDQMELV